MRIKKYVLFDEVKDTIQPKAKIPKLTYPFTHEECERWAILKTLHDCNWNRKEAAEQLGVSRRTITYKVAQYRSEGYMVPVRHDV